MGNIGRITGRRIMVLKPRENCASGLTSAALHGLIYTGWRRSVESFVYKLVIDGIVVAAGNKKAMHKLRKQRGGIVYLSPSSKIGDPI
jgi:hypothetical protein